jgi:hypothetical protein
VRVIDLFLFFDNESTGKEQKFHVQGYQNVASINSGRMNMIQEMNVTSI